MKEIPILFSTAMVQALLSGRKTKTRRIIDPQPIWSVETDGNLYEGNHKVDGHPDWPHQFAYQFAKWKKGDLLWVRENWQLKGWDFEEGTMTVKFATGETHNCLAHDPDEDSSWLMDKVDWLEDHGYIIPNPANPEMFVFTAKKQPFKPYIHMPKEAARIWLQVTDIRVERLQDISEQDAIAEGIESYHMIGDLIAYKNYSETARKDFLNKSSYGFDSGKETHSAPVASFCSLWVDINGRESWISNPWGWVISFKILSTTGKPDLNNQ